MKVLHHSAALLACVAFLAACSHSAPPSSPTSEIREVSGDSVGENFEILEADGRIYVTYPDLSSLSLNLIRLDFPGTAGAGQRETGPVPPPETIYLDRISETPEIDSRFGTAALIVQNGQLNICYSDRERNGTPVLKWISGPSEDGRWWIDILPFFGEPLAVMPSELGPADVFLLEGGALVRRNLSGEQSEQLLNPFDPMGDVCRFSEGLTVFDRSSQKLYALWPRPTGTHVRALYTAGAVHHSTVHDRRLCVLLYDPHDSALLLLEQQRGDTDREPFSVTRVTLCVGTTSVFLDYLEDRPYFVYSEQLEDPTGARRYILSLLAPAAARSAEPGYRKVELYQAGTPVRRIRVSRQGGQLAVFFVQETLKLLSLDLGVVSSE